MYKALTQLLLLYAFLLGAATLAVSAWFFRRVWGGMNRRAVDEVFCLLEHQKICRVCKRRGIPDYFPVSRSPRSPLTPMMTLAMASLASVRDFTASGGSFRMVYARGRSAANQ